MAVYVDTSALVKLVVAEAETPALRTWITAQRTDLVSSDLARVELMRAVRRAAPDRAVVAQQVLDAFTLIELTTSIAMEAGRLDPPGLRTLDALHLATALLLGDDLDALVTYDERMAAAARSAGVNVISPR